MQASRHSVLARGGDAHAASTGPERCRGRGRLNTRRRGPSRLPARRAPPSTRLLRRAVRHRQERREALQEHASDARALPAVAGTTLLALAAAGFAVPATKPTRRVHRGARRRPSRSAIRQVLSRGANTFWPVARSLSAMIRKECDALRATREGTRRPHRARHQDSTGRDVASACGHHRRRAQASSSSTASHRARPR